MRLRLVVEQYIPLLSPSADLFVSGPLPSPQGSPDRVEDLKPELDLSFSARKRWQYDLDPFSFQVVPRIALSFYTRPPPSQVPHMKIFLSLNTPFSPSALFPAARLFLFKLRVFN